MTAILFTLAFHAVNVLAFVACVMAPYRATPPDEIDGKDLRAAGHVALGILTTGFFSGLVAAYLLRGIR